MCHMAEIAARSRDFEDKHVGDGITALMYAPSSNSTSRTDPVASSLNDVTCAGTSQACNWNGVERRCGGRPGPWRSRIPAMVVCCGMSFTRVRRVSLNVFRRHVRPPHCAALGADDRLPAAAAVAAPAASKIRAKNPKRFMFLASGSYAFTQTPVYSESYARAWR